MKNKQQKQNNGEGYGGEERRQGEWSDQNNQTDYGFSSELGYSVVEELEKNRQKDLFQYREAEYSEEFYEEEEEEEDDFNKVKNELNSFGNKNINNNNQMVNKQKNMINNNNNNNTFLYFSMSDCKFCKEFSKTWTELKKEDKYRNKINFVNLDINEKGDRGEKIRYLMRLYNVNSFPTLILLNNEKAHYFNGKRTMNTLTNFIDSNN